MAIEEVKEINVDELMEKVRAKIKKKNEMGIYTESEIEKVLGSGKGYDQKDYELRRFFADLSKKWDTRENRPITSHRSVVGPFIVFFKNVLRKFLDISLVKNVLLSSQAEFNQQLLSFLAIFYDRSSEALMGGKYLDVKQEITLLKQRLDRILTVIENKHDLSRRDVANLVEEKKHLMDHQYLLFERKFRGEDEDVKKRLETYISYFIGTDNVLDVGCGKGEFIEILKDQRINASGIDTNEDMIFLCKGKKLNVKQADALAYLSSANDDSYGGLFASHVIEHFDHGKLIEFTRLCYAKLKEGAPIIFETPNPLSIVVSATNFHLDMSHVKQLHPEAVKFLMGSCGFKNVTIKFISPFPEEMKLQKIDFSKSVNSENLEILNENIEKLNKLLFDYQDYAVIANK